MRAGHTGMVAVDVAVDVASAGDVARAGTGAENCGHVRRCL